MRALEELAEVEHNQWVKWSKDVAGKENLSPDCVERWKSYWIPYSDLNDDVKELDRNWARKSIEALDVILLPADSEIKVGDVIQVPDDIYFKVIFIDDIPEAGAKIIQRNGKQVIQDLL